MLKKILVISGLLFLTFFFVGGARYRLAPGGVVSAQEDANTTITEAFEDIQEPLLSPDSPFYFLQQWRERIETFFAQSEEARTNLELEHARRRVGEMKHLARVNRLELMERARERWQAHLEKAQERVEKMVQKREEVRERVLEATSKHLAVLEKVYESAPEQAKEGLQRAIENAKRHQEVILERFSPEKIEGLKERIKTRLEHFQKKHNLLEKRFKDLLPKIQGEK